MPLKRSFKAVAATSEEALADSFVYVLILESINHGGGDPLCPLETILGVYDSKEAAAQHAGRLESGYGRFEEAIASMFEEAYTDNRKIPPDEGILMQLGDEDYGEGDREILYIKKCELKRLPVAPTLKSKKRK